MLAPSAHQHRGQHPLSRCSVFHFKQKAGFFPWAPGHVSAGSLQGSSMFPSISGLKSLSLHPRREGGGAVYPSPPPATLRR